MIRRLARTIAVLSIAGSPLLAQASMHAAAVANHAQPAVQSAHDSTDCAAIFATLHSAIQAKVADGTLDSASLATLHAALMSAHSGMMTLGNDVGADSLHATLHAMLMDPNSHIQLDSATHAALFALVHGAAGAMPADSSAHAAMAAAMHGTLICTGKM